MARKKQELAVQGNNQIDETELFKHVSEIIENRKYRMQTAANSEATIMFWEVGQYVNSVILDAKRAAYGKKIVATLSHQLHEKHGKSFELTNFRRMMRFAENFVDYEIVATLSPQLSWSHIIELLPLKTYEEKIFYANDTIKRQFGVRELRREIARKTYERREIANSALSKHSTVPFNTFKDPFLLDILNLKDNYLEADLEKAIL